MQRLLAISDLHIGGASAPMLGDPGTLCRFLDEVASRSRGGETVELVINGDFVDFLSLPKCEAWTRTESGAAGKLEECFQQFSSVFDSLARAAKSVDRFTVLLGNHDIELAYPQVRRRLFERLETDEHRLLFLTNNEAYRRGDLHIEHGNRYDAWNAIDYDGLRHLVSAFSRGENYPAMEICPGSTLVEQMVWPLKETYPFIDLLKPETKVLPLLLVALEPSKFGAFHRLSKVAQGWMNQLVRMQPWRFEIKPSAPKYIASPSFRTGLPLSLTNLFPAELTMLEKSAGLAAATTGVGFDGLAASLKLGRPVPQGQLVKIQEALRCVLDGDRTFDGDSSDGPYYDAAKKLFSRSQDGWPAPKIVVMGHTHAPRYLGKLESGVYLNTGAWVDMIRPPGICLQASETGIRELLKWLEQLVADSAKLRERDPRYADLTLNDGGELAQPESRPMLRSYGPDRIF